MKFVRATWKYHNVSSVQIAEDLDRLPGMIDEIEGMAGRGLLDGEDPTAADLQIGSSIWVIGTIADVRPSSEEHTSELQSLMSISYAALCLNQKITQTHL